jgi:hypothetical protein
VQLIGLSVSGAKWIRYSLPLLPFLYLAGGYAVQRIWKFARERGLSLSVVGGAAVIVFGFPLLGLQSWGPFYSFYLNSIGGGKENITRYFAPDEVSEFDTREVARHVCRSAPTNAVLATARPMSMAYYLQACGRADMKVMALYDPHYIPHDGDLIILEPSRRFLETQRFFDVIGNSGMSHREVRVGPIRASTIYLFDCSVQGARTLLDDSTLSQSHVVPPCRTTQESASLNATTSELSDLTRRPIQ